MKTKDFQKLREMSVEDLQAKEKELKEELFNLRFQQAIGQLANPMRLKECKRDIAKVKTVLTERATAK